MYNENLEDISGDVINQLQIRNRRLRKICTILAVTIAAIIFAIALTWSAEMEVKHEIDKQCEDLQREEIMLTLKYSIGQQFIDKEQTEVNDSVLMEFLVQNYAWYPEYVVAQAKIESANYTSPLYQKTNNLFGMKKVRTRKHTQTGEFSGYGSYINWQMSVIDRILWEIFTFKGMMPDEDSYLNALRSYAEDEEYVSKVISTAQTLKR